MYKHAFSRKGEQGSHQRVCDICSTSLYVKSWVDQSKSVSLQSNEIKMRISLGINGALAACWLFVVAVVPGGTIATNTYQITIDAGDTFWIIANRYDITIAALEAANPGVNPADLQVGQVINLPSSQDAVESNIVLQSSLGTTSLEEINLSSTDQANDALPLGPQILCLIWMCSRNLQHPRSLQLQHRPKSHQHRQ